MKNTAIALSLLIGLSAITTSTAEDVMIVYDGSNSMWGQIDGIAKIETAREVMADLIETWPQSTNLGLMAYGHRREGDCGDIELMIPPGPVDANSFLATVNGITPRGKTPLTDAVVEAAETLSFRDNPATVVLISDGIESCQADPCSIAAELEQQGIAFTTHVIGFDVAREDQRQLSCIAENTGGTFVPAQDADELRNAMTQVQAVIQTAPEPEPQDQPLPLAAVNDEDLVEGDPAEAQALLTEISHLLDSSQDFDRAAVFRRLGITFPLQAAPDIGVIQDAKGMGLMTVDQEGAFQDAAVTAAVLAIITTLNAAVEQDERPLVAADLPTADKPAVPIRRSITPSEITCLEDGRTFSTGLRAHLRAAYGLTPDAYRLRWDLPRDYPMVAPNAGQARQDAGGRLWSW